MNVINDNNLIINVKNALAPFILAIRNQKDIITAHIIAIILIVIILFII